MLQPTTVLAAALGRVGAVARDQVLRSAEMTRQDRELLLARRYLREIIRGWYAFVRPDAPPGDTVIWHSTYWPFVSQYLAARFKKGYCLAAEPSLDIWAGRTTTPTQLIVMIAKGGKLTLDLPTGTSILVYPNPTGIPAQPATRHGIQIMPLGVALARATPTFFRLDPLAAEITLSQIRREDLTRALLADWNAAAAGRLAGALRHISRPADADALIADCEAAGYPIREDNPFERPPELLGIKFEWPQAARVHALWHRMREATAATRPPAPAALPNVEEYLQQANAIYRTDAYNSLSIEGYRVTPDLIARIAAGDWDPERPEDRQQRDALAARGYFDAHKLVLDAIRVTRAGQNSGQVLEDVLPSWYRALFGPSVQAGIVNAADLAGYRNHSVFIQHSEHVPPNHEAVPACMEALFRLLREESDPWIRAVLGHFAFVFIHPYPDGNGRVARFLMNLMLASGGYPWTVIRLESRDAYMSGLEQASVAGNITPFAQLVANEMTAPQGHA